MGASGHVHLIGSVPLANEAEVFSTVAENLAGLIRRIPDGETGERTNWIRWQLRVFEGCTGLELANPSAKIEGFKDMLARPFFKLRDGTDAATLKLPGMGFAREAIKSYATFAKLEAAGRIAPGTRFQVCLPTAVPLAGTFIVPEHRAAVEPAIERALAQEVAEMAAAIPNGKLSIQWDVCIEVVGADGGFPLWYDRPIDGGIERVCRHLGFVPAGIEAGIHLCYGDPGHKHIIEPKDLGTCVIFTNRITAQSLRPVSFVHIPVPRDSRTDAFYRPLQTLAVTADMEIYLGLVHFTDGLPGTMERIEVAQRHLKDFGVATECGFGRRDPSTVPALLDLHRAAAACTR